MATGFKSVLSPPASIGTAVGVGALVFTIYNTNMPPQAVVQATQAFDGNLESARKMAAYTSVAVVAAISLLTKDITIFTFGGAVVIVMDWCARHSMSVHPETGQIVTQTPMTPTLQAVS